MKNITIIPCFLLLLIILMQQQKIRNQKEILDEWETTSIKWRDSMDTCINRNHRLYYELESLKEYKIMKLQEDENRRTNDR